MNRRLFFTSRLAQLVAKGVLCLAAWVLAMRIDGGYVLRYLQRFVIYDDGRYLLTAAVGLVLLNTIRAVPLYLGWFFIGEGLSFSRRGKMASWLVPLLAIPSTYLFVSRDPGGFSLHFGVPALFSLLSVFILHFSTRDLRSWFARAVVLSLLVFSFQWLDIAPILTRWGFGGGELSMAVKALSVMEEWDWVIDALSACIFATAFAGGIIAAVLLIGTNILGVQYRMLRARDIKIAELRESAIRDRGYKEIQNLVHDLRRPLTAILGLADVMAETLPSCREADYARHIVKTGAQMNHMIEELLEEDARRDITVGDLLEYLKSQVSAFDWRHIVEVRAALRTSELVVCVNLTRLSRAFVNLLDNASLAVKGKEAPGIVFAADAERDKVLFTVLDNGRGFSNKFLENRGFSEWGSTGMGLAFVSDVAANHGGSFSISNLPGGGAAATIMIPLKEV